jgi:hypothetical protein
LSFLAQSTVIALWDSQGVLRRLGLVTSTTVVRLDDPALVTKYLQARGKGGLGLDASLSHDEFCSWVRLPAIHTGMSADSQGNKPLVW